MRRGYTRHGTAFKDVFMPDETAREFSIISVRVPAAQRGVLQAIQTERGLPNLSAAVREALDEYVREHGAIS